MAPDPPKTAGTPPKISEDPPKILGGPERPRGGPQIRAPARTRLRNRRFAALRELLKGGEYFSEEQMRLRAPALFHHYIGRFRNPKIPPGDPKIRPGDPKTRPGPPQNLRELLLSSLEEAALGDC
ncbi:CCD97 protein, partial [Daphoenositta chrysoptera]|nr:CCD97 protein [Daphoenositta chrysoptera]